MVLKDQHLRLGRVDLRFDFEDDPVNFPVLRCHPAGLGQVFDGLVQIAGLPVGLSFGVVCLETDRVDFEHLVC